MPTTLSVLIITQKLQKGKKNFGKGRLSMKTKELDKSQIEQIMSLLVLMPDDKKRKLYYMVMGAIFAAEHQFNK